MHHLLFRAAFKRASLVLAAAAALLPVCASAQGSQDAMGRSLTELISRRAYVPNLQPGQNIQFEWTQGGCEANYHMVNSNSNGVRLELMVHFPLSTIGAVNVNPNGFGGYEVKIIGARKFQAVVERYLDGVRKEGRRINYPDLMFHLRDRDDAYRAADMLRRTVAAC